MVMMVMVNSDDGGGSNGAIGDDIMEVMTAVVMK